MLRVNADTTGYWHDVSRVIADVAKTRTAILLSGARSQCAKKPWGVGQVYQQVSSAVGVHERVELQRAVSSSLRLAAFGVDSENVLLTDDIRSRDSSVSIVTVLRHRNWGSISRKNRGLSVLGFGHGGAYQDRVLECDAV